MGLNSRLFLRAGVLPRVDGQKILLGARKPLPYKTFGILGFRFPDLPAAPRFDPLLAVNQVLPPRSARRSLVHNQQFKTTL